MGTSLDYQNADRQGRNSASVSISVERSRHSDISRHAWIACLERDPHFNDIQPVASPKSFGRDRALLEV